MKYFHEIPKRWIIKLLPFFAIFVMPHVIREKNNKKRHETIICLLQVKFAFLVTSLPQFQSRFLKVKIQKTGNNCFWFWVQTIRIYAIPIRFSRTFIMNYIFLLKQCGTEERTKDLVTYRSQFLRTTLRLVFFQKVSALEGAAIMFVSKTFEIRLFGRQSRD